jgi:hypothetical protein
MLARDGVGYEGFVLSQHFLGEAALLSVIFKGIEQPLAVRLPAPIAPRAGESAQFSVDAARILLFSADGTPPI